MNRNWWGATWFEKMQRLAEGTRFAEGTKFALSNRVQQLTFEGSTIQAMVQGPAEPPYKVRITFVPFTEEQWEQLFAAVRDPRALAESLDSGDMPLEVQTAFSKAKLRFMPERYADLHLECGCPDWLKPCRHLVAVWMRFAREFDRDPFLLFQLRGMKRDDLYLRMQGFTSAAAEPEAEVSAEAEEEPESFPVNLQDLPSDPEAFWADPPLPTGILDVEARSVLDDDIFDKLGPAKFIRNWPSFAAEFHHVYDSVYEFAMLVLRKLG